MREAIIEHCGVDILEEDMFLDQFFDDALIGVCFEFNEYCPAYDLNMLVEKIQSVEKVDEKQVIDILNNYIEMYPMVSFIKYLNESQEELSLYNENMMFLVGYGSSCLVGVRFRHQKNVVAVYDDTLCVEYLMEYEGMGDLDAIEYFEYNTRGSYLGVNTPAFLTVLD